MFIKNGDPQPITSIIIEANIDDEDTKTQLEQVLIDVSKNEKKIDSKKIDKGGK